MTQNLKKHFFSGVVWNGTRQFLGQGIQTVTTLVLARLLSPEEFGIIGIANIFILFANTINQLGISSAIIQRKDIDEGHLSSAFWANMATGIILCLIMMLISYPAAKFFRSDLVQPVLTVLSFMFIFGALRIVQNTQFSRNLEFGRLAGITVWEMLSNSAVSILLAAWGWGVWSLVWGRLFGVAVGTCMAWRYSPWRPRFLFDTAKFKQLFSFGVHSMSVSMLTYLGRNIDYIIVGRFLGTVPLGFYTMAYNIVTLPERKMSSIITSVAFPTFSKIQDDNARVSKNYLKILSYISFVTFPLLLGFMMVCPYFVNTVLSEKWAQAILPMQIMCVLGMVSSVSTTIGSIFYAKGRPDIEFKADFLNLAALAAALTVGVRFGIVGVAVAVTAVAVIGTPIILWVIARLIQTSFKEIYRALHPALISSLSMALVLAVCDQWLTRLGAGPLGKLCALIPLGVVSYFCFQRIYRITLMGEMIEIFKQNAPLRKKVA